MSVTAPASKTAENVPDEIGGANLSSLPFEVVERGKERRKRSKPSAEHGFKLDNRLLRNSAPLRLKRNSEIRLPRLWLEFIDYWLALPGLARAKT